MSREFFAPHNILPPYSNAVPTPEFHRSVALLLSSQSRIPFSGVYDVIKLHGLTSQSPHPKNKKHRKTLTTQAGFLLSEDQPLTVLGSSVMVHHCLRLRDLSTGIFNCDDLTRLDYRIYIGIYQGCFHNLCKSFLGHLSLVSMRFQIAYEKTPEPCSPSLHREKRIPQLVSIPRKTSSPYVSSPHRHTCPARLLRTSACSLLFQIVIGEQRDCFLTRQQCYPSLSRSFPFPCDSILRCTYLHGNKFRLVSHIHR